MMIHLLVAFLVYNLNVCVVAGVGVSWKQLPVQMSTISNIVIESAKSIYVAAFDPSEGSALLHSRDGGNAWSKIKTTGANMAAALTEDKKTFCGVGSQFYCFFRHDSEKELSFEGNDLIEFTPRSTIREIHPYGFSGFAFVGLFSTVEALYNGLVVNPSLGYAEWEYYDIGVNREAGYQALGAAFPSNLTWYVISGSWPVLNPLASNMLSGRLNVLITANISYQIEFHSLAQVPPKSYYGAISKTSDGGKTWQQVYNSNQLFYFNQIDCFDQNTCLAVGEGSFYSYVVLTHDGGEHWDIVLKLNGKFSLRTCKMTSQTEYWIGGGIMADHTGGISDATDPEHQYLGVLYHSTDRGMTWTTSSTEGYVYDLSFYHQSSDVAYATTIHRNYCGIAKLVME